jgi:hypothetical protein
MQRQDASLPTVGDPLNKRLILIMLLLFYNIFFIAQAYYGI